MFLEEEWFFFKQKLETTFDFFACSVWGTDTVVPFEDRRRKMLKVVFLLKKNHSASKNMQKKKINTGSIVVPLS